MSSDEPSVPQPTSPMIKRLKVTDAEWDQVLPDLIANASLAKAYLNAMEQATHELTRGMMREMVESLLLHQPFLLLGMPYEKIVKIAEASDAKLAAEILERAAHHDVANEELTRSLADRPRSDQD